jgi:hypothetical protein
VVRVVHLGDDIGDRERELECHARLSRSVTSTRELTDDAGDLPGTSNIGKWLRAGSLCT